MGSAVSLCNIVVHALVMAIVVRAAQFVGAKKTLHPTLFLIAGIVATVSVLMAAHAFEVIRGVVGIRDRRCRTQGS